VNADDPKNDPIAPGNDLSSMLNSSSADDAKIDHLVGFTFISPDPQLSPVNPPTFDAVEAMQEGIYADGVPASNATAGTPRTDDDRPILPLTPATQATDLPVEIKNTAVDPWDQVVNTWTATTKGDGPEMGRMFVEAWSDVFGWSVPTLPVPAAATSSGVTGATGATRVTGTTGTNGTTSSPDIPTAPVAPVVPPAPPVGNAVITQSPLVSTKPEYVMGIGDKNQKNFKTFYLDLPWLTSGVSVTAAA
jgi:hypothetical protein